MGRPYKNFERINRLFPRCIETLSAETITESEKHQRELFIAFCLRVCEMIATQHTPDKGGAL